MFVVLVGSVLTTLALVRDVGDGARRDLGFTFQLALWLWFTVLFANFAEAMAEGRGKAQADALRKTRTADAGQAPAAIRRDHRDVEIGVRRPSCARATSCSAARRRHPGRRRGRRGRRVGGRVGDHRRVRAGHPRVRRRPLGRDRRHQGAVRLARRPDHRESGRDVPRPDDRAGRGRDAAEDAERDRAHDPALRAHDHLPARRRHAAAVRDLQRRRRSRCRSSSRSWSASSRRPSAACSRPSASPAWTG